MSSDALIRFEEDNWDDLVDKFTKKYRNEWEQFVMDEYEDNSRELNFEDERILK